MNFCKLTKYHFYEKCYLYYFLALKQRNKSRLKQILMFRSFANGYVHWEFLICYQFSILGWQFVR